jgi:hypothetical protein
MIKTAGTIFTLVVIGTVAIAWSHAHKQAPQPAAFAETISPEKIVLSGGPLTEQHFNDRSFVFTDND